MYKRNRSGNGVANVKRRADTATPHDGGRGAVLIELKNKTKR